MLLTRPALRIIAAELNAVIKVLLSIPFVFQALRVDLALSVAALASMSFIHEVIISVINVLIAPVLDSLMLQKQGTYCSRNLDSTYPAWVAVASRTQ